MNYQGAKDEIIDWLSDNYSTIRDILYHLNTEREIMLRAEADFFEEINEQYKERAKALIGEEISRQLGMPIDSIYEVLESSEVQEYLIDDSLCFNDNSRESASE